MKKLLLGAALLAATPFCAQAQSLQPGGFYLGAEGGLNWMFNNSFTSTLTFPGFGSGSTTTNLATNMGWTAGGVLGYDFLGPRVELEGVYRENTGTLSISGINGSAGFVSNEIAIMGNVYYDFMAGQAFVPYIGAGAGVAFMRGSALGGSATATTFAYQAMVGVGYNVTNDLRLNLEGRYHGTTTPNYSTSGSLGSAAYTLSNNPTNNNVSLMAGLVFKFGAAAPPPPPPAPAVAPPSFMVFFDWDRANLSQQALNTIKQASDAYKAKGNARITATGHTDTSGSASYNMALSLRRANAVKDAL
ncbi:MAG: acyloxyacyl hydrolase, partial [Proteobacteria bacterium]|nr:acyloxyacyl hydrolase [Pseudomonadota bacterium]